jgi:hypothetical protein
VTSDETGARKEFDRNLEQENCGEELDCKELLANIRRLTITVLDNLDQGSRDRTLDQGEKRLLSSTGARLLRLWRSTLKDESKNEAIGQARKRVAVSEEPNVSDSLI